MMRRFNKLGLKKVKHPTIFFRDSDRGDILKPSKYLFFKFFVNLPRNPIPLIVFYYVPGMIFLHRTVKCFVGLSSRVGIFLLAF